MESVKTGTISSPSSMTLIAIVVNYYTEEFLPDLLCTLDLETEIDQIVVADNGSDADLSKLAAGFTKVEVHKNGQNFGFGKAINRVVERYPATHYLIINPDTLPSAGFTRHLLDAASQTGAMITGPRFYWDTGKTFRLPPALGYSWEIHHEMVEVENGAPTKSLIADRWNARHEGFWQATTPFPEPFLSGACLLIRKDPDFFPDHKLFDERFFLYYEDTDLCYRALTQGKSMVVAPRAEVVHFWDQSPSTAKARLMAESRERFLSKHPQPMDPIPATPFAKSPPEHVINLGILTTNEPFNTSRRCSERPCYFELGLSPAFIPFAQSDHVGDSFVMPDAVFHRLQPGTYYCRIRGENTQNGTIWKWQKA